MTQHTVHNIAHHINILSGYAENGDCEHYWTYLAILGVKYAQLALAVVRNDSLSGMIANGYARLRAKELGVTMLLQDWNALAKALISNDLAYRKAYAKNVSTYDLVLPIIIPRHLKWLA